MLRTFVRKNGRRKHSAAEWRNEVKGLVVVLERSE